MIQHISKFQIKILKWIATRIVVQSFFHTDNIITYYKIMTDAAREEFVEDNKSTLNSFLTRCHKESLK